MASDLPILDPLGDDDDQAPEAPRTVLLTGAAGNVGRKLRAAWADRYDILPVDCRFDPADPDLIVADLSVWDESWSALFDEADAVVHLAANSDPASSWDALCGPNLDAVAHVLLAAATSGVERFVFASSNHAMGGYREAGHSGPITPDLPPNPGNAYGASKLAGERFGRCIAEVFGMSVVAIRLGSVLPGPNRPEDVLTHSDPAHRDVWLSDGDLARLFTCAVEAELEEGEFVLVHGVSNNAGSPWPPSGGERIGYAPEDGLDA